MNVTRTAAIVTGHSRGIGEAISAHLLALGARVLGVSRKTNTSLTARFPKTLEEAQLDLADSSALARWLEGDALDRFAARAEMLLLVNNAGVLQPIGPPHMQELDLVARAVTVNVSAALMFTAAFARATANVGERRVMHVSSGAGRKAYAGWSVYCATKAAMDHHARCVALDNLPRFRISSIAPGVVDTEMQAEIRASTDERFPERPRFVGLHRDQKLPSAATTGGRAAEYLLSDEFGVEAVYDLASFQSQPA